jgi:CheY-like chemotaxis protein
MESGKDILLVEDDAGIRDALALILGIEGYCVAAAGNGQEALDYLRQRPPPRLILLDLLMPVLDGWHFRQEQRADPALAKIPVVILSAVENAPAEAARLGAAGYIHKPIETAPLLATVRLFAAPRQAQILILEDRPAVGSLLASALRRHGLTVHQASGCRQAVEIYRQHKDAIGLVFLDLQTPGINAGQILAELRQLNPDVRCCFVNRHPEEPASAQLVAQGAKPAHSLDEAVQTLRQMAHVC